MSQTCPGADSCTAANNILWARSWRERCSSSIRKSGRTPTLRAAHEDVTHPPARCVRELHTTHFADARRGWRHVGNARLNRCAEIAGTDVGIKRLCESGGRDDVARTTAIASLLMTFFLRDPFSTAQHRRST